MNVSLHSDDIIYMPRSPYHQAAEADYLQAWTKLNQQLYRQRHLITDEFFALHLQFFRTADDVQRNEIRQLETQQWHTRLQGINASTNQQAAYAEQVKEFQRQGSPNSKKRQNYSTSRQLPKNPRKAPLKNLHEFLVKNGCPVPATSITFAPWFNPPPPLTLPSGRTERTTLQYELAHKSYSFTATVVNGPPTARAMMTNFALYPKAYVDAIIREDSDELTHRTTDEEDDEDMGSHGYYSPPSLDSQDSED